MMDLSGQDWDYLNFRIDQALSSIAEIEEPDTTTPLAVGRGFIRDASICLKDRSTRNLYDAAVNLADACDELIREVRRREADSTPS
jgi:hypothetical protein